MSVPERAIPSFERRTPRCLWDRVSDELLGAFNDFGRRGRIGGGVTGRRARPSSEARRASTRNTHVQEENIMMRNELVAAVVATMTAATTAWSQEAIKVGGLLETSGFIASLGQPGLEGAMLAVEQINAKGGIAGKKLELININTESDNTKTVSAVKRLTEQDKIVAIVGPMNSGSSFASIDTVQRSETPMISNGGSRGIVLPAADKKWIFLAPLTDVLVQSVMLADMKKKGVKKIALLNSDTPFGTS